MKNKISPPLTMTPKINTMPQENESNKDDDQRRSSAPYSSNPFVGRQSEIDWSLFAMKFEEKFRYAPIKTDPEHKEYYLWFICGAHAEFMGRLNSQQNAPAHPARPTE